jgi:hypothetical protein
VSPNRPPFASRSADDREPLQVERHAHEIELFYLPSYAPDHTPTEYLNNDLKQQLRQQPQAGSEQELIERTRSVLRAIQRSPRRVQAYFKPEPVRYAA